MLDLSVQPRRIVIAGVIAALVLVAIYVATQAYRVKVAPGKLNTAMKSASWPATESAATAQRERIVNPRGLVKMFDLDGEGNIPAIWSVIQLLAAAGLLAVIASHARRMRDRAWWLWAVLAFGFMFLAIDEGGSIHSSFYLAASDEASRRARGIFYFSWVIPALIAVALIGLAYLRFLWNLPAATRWMFIGAGALYVASAAGGEMMQGWWVAHGYSKIRLTFAAMTIVEEAGELLAIVLFIYALLDYMRRKNITIAFRVTSEPAAAVEQASSKPIRHIEPSISDIDEEAEIALHR